VVTSDDDIVTRYTTEGIGIPIKRMLRQRGVFLVQHGFGRRELRRKSTNPSDRVVIVAKGAHYVENGAV
jgi:hypothetical protein